VGTGYFHEQLEQAHPLFSESSIQIRVGVMTAG